MLIDIHVHTCRQRHPSLTRPNGTRYPTPPELIGMMDAAGIGRAHLCGVSIGGMIGMWIGSVEIISNLAKP